MNSNGIDSGGSGPRFPCPGSIRRSANPFFAKRRVFPDHRRFFYLALLLLSAGIPSFSDRKSGKTETYMYSAKIANDFFVEGVTPAGEKSNPNCLRRDHEFCTVCGVEVTTGLSLGNKTKTPLLTCRDMKPGPARLMIETHAEPTISGLWEVEFGIGYRNSAREECPHQFIASDNPPLKTAYEIGPLTIESEIPADGMIQALACVGLSSARVGREGKETGALLKVRRLRVVSQSFGGIPLGE